MKVGCLKESWKGSNEMMCFKILFFIDNAVVGMIDHLMPYCAMLTLLHRHYILCPFAHLNSRFIIYDEDYIVNDNLNVSDTIRIQFHKANLFVGASTSISVAFCQYRIPNHEVSSPPLALLLLSAVHG